MIGCKNGSLCVVVTIGVIGFLPAVSTVEQNPAEEISLTYKLQFRIRPTRTLLDLEPKRFEKIMAGIEEVDDYRIYDDVVSDATFITIVVSWKAPPSTATLDSLRATLQAVERVRILVVDKGGNETPLADLNAEGQKGFVTTSN